MPVERYRHVDEVPAPARADAKDPALLERVSALWAFAASAAGPLHPPGVQRFVSIEAAATAREVALLERMRRLASSRDGGEG